MDACNKKYEHADLLLKIRPHSSVKIRKTPTKLILHNGYNNWRIRINRYIGIWVKDCKQEQPESSTASPLFIFNNQYLNSTSARLKLQNSGQ